MVRKKKLKDEPEASSSVGLPFGVPKQLSDGGTKTSLVRQVYDAIMESLDAGELKPGSRIVAAEVAQHLGLSRAPVREALAVLAGQGLVELMPDRGAILRSMTPHDMAEIYEVMAPVISVALRSAALRITEADNAARVTEAMTAIRNAAGDPNLHFLLVLNDYHYLVNAIAEKPYVDFVMRAINIEYWNRLIVHRIRLADHIGQYVRNYQRVTDALLAGDAGGAAAIMQYHANWCATLIDGRVSTIQR
ncbi:MAG: GntR family transcriptional regulator [Cereibacter sphaeroides]|uniref:GntR family transcriptional regulator n=1 Tax=Cereibacter sphaeroides TaxID=1063 RepID=A0A2W5TH10_CERSP|nr:MAG: GntR family transcriptional regulator [Cereibacter sphaeroides]